MTGVVVTVNVPVVFPDATVMLAGTVAAVLLLANLTVSPALGAGPLSVTVPVEFAPPSRIVGFKVTD